MQEDYREGLSFCDSFWGNPIFWTLWGEILASFSKPVFNTSQNPIVKFSQNAISHPEKTGFSVGVFAEPLPNLIKFPQVLKVS